MLPQAVREMARTRIRINKKVGRRRRVLEASGCLLLRAGSANEGQEQMITGQEQMITGHQAIGARVSLGRCGKLSGGRVAMAFAL